MAELTSAEYAYLIILRAEDREISNTEMDELYEVRLVGPERRRLVEQGYLVSADRPTPYRFVITSRGVDALRRPLTIGQNRLAKGEKRGAGEKQLYWAAMLAQQKLVLRTPVESGNRAASAGAAPVDLAGRVRDAYTGLADGPGRFVRLADLRALLADVSKSELDKVLEDMLDSPEVRLEPEPFGLRVAAEDRSAAVHIGGEDRHKLAIGRR
jgi:hypothetical protein